MKHIHFLMAGIILLSASIGHSRGTASEKQSPRNLVKINGESILLDNSLRDKALSEDGQKAFRSVARLMVNLLLENKIESVAGLDLRKLSAELGTVQFFSITHGNPMAQGRMGHMYDVRNRSVRIQPSILLKDANTFYGKASSQVVILHESLGALGYLDDHYEISSVISALALHLSMRKMSDVKVSLTADHVRILVGTPWRSSHCPQSC